VDFNELQLPVPGTVRDDLVEVALLIFFTPVSRRNKMPAQDWQKQGRADSALSGSIFSEACKIAPSGGAAAIKSPPAAKAATATSAHRSKIALPAGPPRLL
jgi:hypothetical protein